METAKTVDPQVRPDLIDRLIELYCDWRMECAEVQVAYERFSSAAPDNRVLAFAAYTAALDREESAARSYADLIKRLMRDRRWRNARGGVPKSSPFPE